MYVTEVADRSATRRLAQWDALGGRQQGCLDKPGSRAEHSHCSDLSFFPRGFV